RQRELREQVLIEPGETALFSRIEVDEIKVPRLGEPERGEEHLLAPGGDREADPSAAGHDRVRSGTVESDPHEGLLPACLYGHDRVAISATQQQLALANPRGRAVGLD